jgi:hypothetical protein
VWLLAAPLLAGVPVSQFAPGAWTALAAQLGGGMLDLTERGVTGDANAPWILATALLLAGAAWIAAAGLARRHAGAAFAAGAAPWMAAVLLHPSHTTVWQGAAVVMVGLLWRAGPRTSATTAVALSVVVALVSGVSAQAFAPRDAWLDRPGPHGHARAAFRALDTEPTFERPTDRRNGAPMLEIKANQPAFWRMQVLDVFDGRTWRASAALPRLEEPAAKPERVDVRVRRLRNDLVASPGEIEGVATLGTARPVAGSAWRLAPGPETGDEYHVDARVVRADAGGLQRAKPPRGARAAAYTRLGWGPRSPRAPAVVRLGAFTIPLTPPIFRHPEPSGFPIDPPLFGEPVDAGTTAALGRSPYRNVAALAHRLASGTRTEWQVVARVMSYLRDEGRFRYTTDVGRPGPFPLSDFLLRTHAGYCQHFAGAAALLLRMAGVPARVVAGFATGVRSNGGFDVRDVDAHDWIEVYFAGYGWVPFNPTPGAAPAAIAPQLDLLPAAGGRTGGSDPRRYVLLGVLAALAFAGWRRRRRPQLDEALGRLLGTPVRPSTTLGELREELARTLGPHTAALAAEAERERFAPSGASPRRWTRARIARALARDVGPARALSLLAGAAGAGARSSQRAAPGDLA